MRLIRLSRRPPADAAGPPAPGAGRRPVLHPALIAAFPVLSLYAHNAYEAPLGVLVAPLALTVVGAVATWLALRLLVRDAQRAGLLASLVAVLFFSYDGWKHALEWLIPRVTEFWVRMRPDLPVGVVLATMAVAAAPAVWWIVRRMRDPARWTSALNGFGAVLVALPISSVAMTKLREPLPPARAAAVAAPVAVPARRPDIYYIILDGYARSDVMKELYDFDNTGFLRRLEARGFFVAGRSTSNYAHTRISIPSSINFEFADALLAPGARDPNPLDATVGDNRIMRTLRPLGYRFVAFASGFDPTECPSADVYLAPGRVIDGFHRMVAGMTPIAPLLFRGEMRDYYWHYRERILYILDRLPGLARMPGPKFTFAHIVCPHPPFAFGEDGEDTSPRDKSYYPTDDKGWGGLPAYRAGYRRQAVFITKRIEAVIDRILAESPEPPIIVLQSDHGSGLHLDHNDAEKTDLHERFSNLTCVYFPGRDYTALDDRITPVDLFRVVLNTHFSAGLPLMGRRNLFSPAADPLSFTDVTDRIPDRPAASR